MYTGPASYSWAAQPEEAVVNSGGNVWPECRKCQRGNLLPLSDFGSQGAPIHYKAWVCSNPECGFNIKIRNGDVFVNEPITSGASHTPRMR
ncbi:MAG: hypothetical protein FJ312_00325 [SAR202 cluster bacterium]|nr:hypothetical protein [SAR202 cluster bacterium]